MAEGSDKDIIGGLIERFGAEEASGQAASMILRQIRCAVGSRGLTIDMNTEFCEEWIEENEACPGCPGGDGCHAYAAVMVAFCTELIKIGERDGIGSLARILGSEKSIQSLIDRLCEEAKL